MARQGTSFIVTLQLDTPPQSILTLTFDLREEPVILTGAPPPEHCGKGKVEWLYDEWEKLPGEQTGWAISILLSNGWEIYLQLRE